MIESPSFSFGDQTFTIPLQDIFALICPFFVWMGFLNVAFAMWRGAEIVARGL